jgi:hypothetical protein
VTIRGADKQLARPHQNQLSIFAISILPDGPPAADQGASAVAITRSPWRTSQRACSLPT